MEYYLSRLINCNKELLLDGVGGYPSSLNYYISHDLQVFRKFNITPVFVLKGIRTNPQLSHSLNNNENTELRSAKWESYYKDYHRNPNKSLLNFTFKPKGHYRTLDTNGYIHDLVEFCTVLKLEYIIAPYTTASQLAYLLSINYIDAVYGATECLLLPQLNKIITGMDFIEHKIRYIDRDFLLNEQFQIDLSTFQEICTVCSNDFQPDESLLINHFSILPSNPDIFEWLISYTKSSGQSIYYTLLNDSKRGFPKDAARDLNILMATMAGLKYVPIMKVTGEVMVLNESDNTESKKKSVSKGMEEQEKSEKKEDSSTMTDASSSTQTETIPSDIHEIIGLRLPNEYYFYHSIGLLSSKLLEVLSSGKYSEIPLLDTGNNNQMKRLISSKQNINAKNQLLSLLTSPINRYFQNRHYEYVKWYDLDNPTDLDFKYSFSKPLFLKLAHYYRYSDKNTEISSDFDMLKFVTIFNNNDFAKLIVHDSGILSNDENKLKSIQDLLGTSTIRMLYLYDFISFETNKLTAWGEILVKASKIIDSNKQFEKVLLLLIYLKNGSDSIKFFEKFTPDLTSNVDKDYDKNINHLIISRLGLFYDTYLFHSAKNIRENIVDPTSLNELSLPLLSFRSILKYYQIQFFELQSSMVSSILTNDQFDRKHSFKTNQEWRKLVSNLPLKETLPNTVASILFSDFMKNFDKLGNIQACKDIYLKKFGIDLNFEMTAIMKFFTKVFKIIQLCEKLIDENYFKKLMDAKEYLESITKK